MPDSPLLPSPPTNAHGYAQVSAPQIYWGSPSSEVSKLWSHSLQSADTSRDECEVPLRLVCANHALSFTLFSDFCTQPHSLCCAAIWHATHSSQMIPMSETSTSGEEDTWEDNLSEYQIRGRRAVFFAAGLFGQGSRKRKVLFTDTGSSLIPPPWESALPGPRQSAARQAWGNHLSNATCLTLLIILLLLLLLLIIMIIILLLLLMMMIVTMMI